MTCRGPLKAVPATLLLVVFLQCGCAIGEPQPRWPDDEHLVVVNYFAGWWQELPNKWHGQGWRADAPDWRPGNPDRVPVLGEYNTQDTMDHEIAAAASHGVDAFAILYYFPQPGSRQAKDAPMLNRGLETFVNSRNAGMIRFFIEYCNAPDFSARNEEEWQECVDTWVAAMKHPSYLRVDGRLVFKVHGVTQFLKTHNGDLALCRTRLDALRDAVRDAGLGEMIIGVGISGQTPPLGQKWPPASLFDFTGTYMCVPKIEEREEEYPYKRLAEQARTTRNNRVSDPLPWVPHLAAGWNPRPWTYPAAPPHYHRFFAFPTREDFTRELTAMKEAFAKHPVLGLPKKDGTRQKIFTIYAWNEFGEGGIVAPTKGRGHMMLECIRSVFGEEKGKKEPAMNHVSPVRIEKNTFVLNTTGASFVPRGFNYVRLDLEGKGGHATFSPFVYDRVRVTTAFRHMADNGFNVVRVFINGLWGKRGCMFEGRDAAKPDPRYLGNLAEFLLLARQNGVLVVPCFEYFPDAGSYRNGLDRRKERVGPWNNHYLNQTFIDARQCYLRDVIRELRKRDPATLSAVFCWDLMNELCYPLGEPPFSLSEGTVTPANGVTYDLATDKERLADDMAVYWIDQMAAAVRAEIPDALINANVFTYRAVGRKGPGDFHQERADWKNRYPFRPTALLRSTADVIDIHIYAANGATLNTDMQSIEHGRLTAGLAAAPTKALVVGEFGVFKHAFPEFAPAAAWAGELAGRFPDLGAAGWIYWTYDCDEQEELWNAMSGQGKIFNELRNVPVSSDEKRNE